MRHLTLALLSVIATFASVSYAATLTDSLRCYDRLYQLFDSPLGIDEISRVIDSPARSVEDVQAYIDSDAALKKHGYTTRLSTTGNGGQSLTVHFPDNIDPKLSAKIDDLVVTACDDSVTVSYILTPLKDVSTTIDACRSLCASAKYISPTDSEYDEPGHDFRGPFNHYYTASASENGAVAFSCAIPLPTQKWYAIPSYYYPSIGLLDLKYDTPCNTGGETFTTFIRRFNADPTFRNHADLATNTQTQANVFLSTVFLNDFNTFVLKAMKDCGLFPLEGKAVVKEVVYDEEDPSKVSYIDYSQMGQWLYPSSDRVIYSGWNNEIEGLDEYDNNSVVVLFERIDGLWYCSMIKYFGSKIDDTVSRYIQESLNR